MTPRKTASGPGIAAVGYLMVALAAILLVISLKVGQAAGLPPAIYWPPMIVGLFGIALGFIICVAGIIAAWVSIAVSDVTLGWIAAKLPQLHSRLSGILFGLTGGFGFGAAALTMAGGLGFGAGVPLSAACVLGAAVCAFLGAAAKLWMLLVRDLRARV